MHSEPKNTDQGEQGVEVPWQRISPEALRNMMEEFVTREWSELTDAGYSLDDKVAQVLKQLQEKRARVVFDLASGSCNIVVSR